MKKEDLGSQEFEEIEHALFKDIDKSQLVPDKAYLTGIDIPYWDGDIDTANKRSLCL